MYILEVSLQVRKFSSAIQYMMVLHPKCGQLQVICGYLYIIIHTENSYMYLS
jgi:hypothetical protein